jgi:hypothetical protein
LWRTSDQLQLVAEAAPDSIEEPMAKLADFGLCVSAFSFLGRDVDNPLW